MKAELDQLKKSLKGELHYDQAMRTLYATDASAYREMPLAVAFPQGKEDVKTLIDFARKQHTSLIPRTAGTSLAGQVVGNGIIVDVSRTFTKILEVNQEERWVRVQPGVIRDELNMYLKPHGLYFGPETSTANRAMIGGMIGNNSCGSNSVVYGSTRDHLLEAEVVLSDGSETTFNALSDEEFWIKAVSAEVETGADVKEHEIYAGLREILNNKENQDEIRREFPKPSIPRRNTGYALDLLLESTPFTPEKEQFNLCKLLAGSEGTLAFITEAKLAVDLLPPEHKCLVCAHFDSVDEALRANLVALKFEPTACELMDHFILDCTKANIEQQKNRFFVKGEPGAILVVEFAKHTAEDLKMTAVAFQTALRIEELGYHYPVVEGEDIKKVWTLRKAGLGLLSNIPGDAKPAPVIEDTAVDVVDLPAYIRDFNVILDRYNLHCVHYAHAGSGELHLRPIINLKTQEGNQMFRTIADEIAKLVKKYNGSLSGEHGDGRLRGEFIQYMVGPKNYQLFKEVKRLFDPEGIFNPGKIVDTPAMNTMLRYSPGQDTPQFDTIYNFDKNEGLLRAAELCNGSGDCRKTELSGGTMCPSYMASKNEKDTTRARANMLREYLTHGGKSDIASDKDVYEVMDLCLSCKACKSECPSNVDMAKLKGEFLQRYYDKYGTSFRTKAIANFAPQMALASMVPNLYNFLISNKLTSSVFKKITGFAAKRSIPKLQKQTFRAWFRQYRERVNRNFGDKGVVYFFNDEFSNFLDADIAKTAVLLLEKLGYEVKLPPHVESGRTYLSKGLLREAKELAIKNVDLLSSIIPKDAPIIGLEPSAILTLRDEYLDLVYPSQQDAAQQIAKQTFYIDEFIAKEIDAGNIHGGVFTQQEQLIKLHGHCHQKTLSSLTHTKKMLELPKNYKVHLIRSGCCGMAGSFGYEEEHYEMSMKVGELVLFPTVRQQPEEVLIAAPGTSCRHQIKDGTGRKALHPVEILFHALG